MDDRNNDLFTDAKRASVIINELGMRDKLDLRLCAHKHAFDRQRYKLDRDMEGKICYIVEYPISWVIRWSSFSFPNSSKNLDLPYKTDLDFWDCVGRVELVL